MDELDFTPYGTPFGTPMKQQQQEAADVRTPLNTEEVVKKLDFITGAKSGGPDGRAVQIVNLPLKLL